MKSCPQCGGSLRFVANRWMHTTPGRCLLITLQATPDEIAQHRAAPTLPGARYRNTHPPRHGEWKFG